MMMHDELVRVEVEAVVKEVVVFVVEAFVESIGEFHMCNT